ncbi:hypothetical protein FPOAC2_07106 [Fusarium poae]
MADPLSLAASIAGLISLADVTFKYTYKFVRAAKDAKNDVSTLADEINNLGSVLRVLEALASDMEAEGDQFDPTLRNHYLNHCFKTLSRIEMKTKKATERFVRSKVESIYQHLKWPFSASETRSLLDELSRHKETISMALAADSMQKLQLSLTKIDKLGENISKVEKIVKRVEINTLIEVNAQKQRILNYFMKADPQDNLATSIKLRHSMTGLWLTESTDFVRWIDTPGSKLWLTGIPGAGKTVLAGSVIQEVLSRSYSRNDIGVAFFFCDYKNPKTWETVNILGAIANQLARQRKEAFEILNLYYDDLHPPEHIGNNPDSDELRSKISQMSDLFHRTIIVIDGLDECGDNTDDVVDTLIQMIEDSENTSLAVFSRDHYNIRVNLEAEFEIIPIIAHTNDIQLYVGAELDRRVRTQRLQLATLHMKQEIQEVLVSRAEGMFRWVVCQLDYLCDCAHDDERREALSKLPPDLPESYRRLLERVNRCSPRVQDMVQKCLHFLTIDEPKLTIHELRQAVSAPERIGETLNESNTISEQEISRRCSSLIRKSTDGRHFEFAHFSVREFLENRNAVLSSPDLEKYWIDWDSTRALFSAQCLRFLQMANFDSIPIDFEEVFASNISDLYREITETYPFYRHATTWWLRHNDVGFDDSTVLALVKSLFSPSKRACFVLWSIEILHQVSVWNYASVDFHRQACKIVNRSSFRPLHMAAALNLPEICSFLLLEESDANRRAETANYIDLALVSVLAIPGMPDLCTERSKEAPRVRRVVDLFLPSTERRNETIDCLIAKGAHPSSHEISLNSASVFSIVCMLAATFNDLSPITKILSLNISPTLPEIKVLQEWIPKAGSYDDQAELSAKGLMQYLGQPKTHSTDWGREAASVVWSWTLNSGFSFKKDEYLNSGLDVPSEGLDMIQIHSAIRSDDLNIIKRWLNESHRKMERLDLANAHKILHFAVLHSALRVFKYLVDEGCDPYIKNEQGNLPVHIALLKVGTHHPEIFRVFKSAGVALFDLNNNGDNILHLWAVTANPTHDFIKDVFDLDPCGTIKGLQIINKSNHTPLTSLLVHKCDREDLGKIFCCISDLLRSRDQLSTTQPLVESGQDIEYLLGCSRDFQAMIRVKYAPLHSVGSRNSLQQVQLLVRIYPEAVSCRHNGLLPIQRYIEGALSEEDREKSTDLRIVRILLPENLAHSQDSVETLWEWTCRKAIYQPSTVIVSVVGVDDGRPKSPNDIFSIMLQHGVLQAHERQVRECGLIPFASVTRWYDLYPTMRQVIMQTGYWDAIKSSELVSCLFQNTIRRGDLDMIHFLLDQGANIHHYANGHSPIEVAFQGDVALRLCSSDSGIQLYKKILECTDREKLVSSSAYQDLTLLHMLATDKDASSILWLAEELIHRGLEINLSRSGCQEDSAINHHIRNNSFQFAELLLQNGASPLIDGVLPFRIIETVIEAGNAEFLDRILAHAADMSAEVNWIDSNPIFAVNDTQEICVNRGNVLHLAVDPKSIVCLERLLKKWLAKREDLIQKNEFTPLHVAAFKNSVEAVELLLANGFDAMAENNLDQTPLHLAAQVGSVPVVKCLLSHGAFDSFDIFGRSAKTTALELGFTEIVETLEKTNNKEICSANQKRQKLRQRQKHLARGLERAVWAYDYGSMAMLLDSGCPIDVWLPTNQGGTALTWALELERPAVVRWLLERGASTLSAKHTNGVEDSVVEMASARAVFSYQLEEILQKYWLEGGNLITDEDFPFHDAVWNNNTSGIDILLEECGRHYGMEG